MEQKDTVKVKFAIPNTMCRHYIEVMECNRDKKPHTCCQEECTLPEIVFGFKERSIEVHHEFKEGACVHCGDKENAQVVQRVGFIRGD